MKLLFVILLLANIFVALWEYRYGRVHTGPQASESMQENPPSLEKICLVNETAPIPAENKPQEGQSTNPGSLPVKEAPPSSGDGLQPAGKNENKSLSALP